MTIQEIIEIYALYGIVISETEASADLKHATGDNPDEQKLENRIHGYAKQVSLEQEAEEFESNYC